MTELDEVWNRMLSDAAVNAREQGRHDVAEYLSLKAANDTIRAAGVKWLFDSILEIAAASNRANLGISIERVEPFSFPHHGANMVGSQLRLLLGVRCLMVEAGWSRTPSDGFMRGGSLAAARLRHFGMPKANAEIILIKGDSSPIWSDAALPDVKTGLTIADLRRHFTIFLGT
ncbi:MAG: hypothetical protein ACRD43_04050 [Pyrinomonadaceae bacterium]